MEKILVSVDPEETRAAILSAGVLTALEIERASHAHLVGNIYKGCVENVLPGMQAAFVNIGAEKNAFLFIGDGKNHDAVSGAEKDVQIHVGQRLPVQIVKDAAGTKGPRATTHISLPGRFLVLMPTAAYIGMSRRIEREEVRARLHAMAKRLCPAGMGLIVRTAAASADEATLAADVRYLTHLWKSILARFKLRDRGAALLYRDADLLIRMVRDRFTEKINTFLIDDHEAYVRVKDFVEGLSPELADRVKFYEGETSLFHANHIDDAIEKLGAREIPLKSGGFLVIDRTEALTVIDVNTGRYVGNTNFDDTIYQTNLEAAEEIIRQIRLLDIGGIIIVDFIDMERDGQKEHLLEFLRAAAKKDPTKTNVVDITALGLVEITRKKSRSNIESIVYSKCPVCQGRGRIESPETVAIKISRSIRRMEQTSHAETGYEIEVNSYVAAELSASQLLLNLAAEFGTDIKVKANAGMHPEAYTILQQC